MNERTYTTNNHITTLLLRSRVKRDNLGRNLECGIRVKTDEIRVWMDLDIEVYAISHFFTVSVIGSKLIISL